MPRDWKKIETDYMGGNLSYAKIAEKWGVSVRQVEEHGRKNHWTEKRREFRGKVAARAEQKAIDKRASREAEKLLQERGQLLAKAGDPGYIRITADMGAYLDETVCPIICEGDVIGSVVLLNRDEKKKFGELEQNVAQSAAEFL